MCACVRACVCVCVCSCVLFFAGVIAVFQGEVGVGEWRRRGAAVALL